MTRRGNEPLIESTDRPNARRGGGALEDYGVDIELGPVDWIGARGLMTLIYSRDPDGNLVEVSTYPSGRRRRSASVLLWAPLPTASRSASMTSSKLL